MDDFCRRTLRLWAVLDAAYALLLAVLVIFFVPWKLPAANVAVLVFAGLVAGPALWLWRGRRWAWRLGVGTSLLGLAAAVLLAVGLVASWAYLRAIYGGFGVGASLAALLIAGMVIEVLGLYPAIRLRALLRRELRGLMRAGRVPIAVAVALAVLPLPVALAVELRFGLRPVAALPPAAAGQALALLRARADGRPLPPAPALDGVPLGPGPLYVTLWQGGAPVVRVTGRGADLQAAVRQAGEALALALGTAGRDANGDPRRGQLKLDRVVARAPVVERPAGLLALSIDPGLDGLEDGGGRLGFLPDDVLRARVAGSAAPMPELDELRLGIDPGWMRAQLPGGAGSLRRIRVESWLEREGGALAVYRGNTRPDVGPGPLPLRQAAVSAGDFILRQVETDGRFTYRYDPIEDANLGGGEYNLTRHAGTAYGLTLLYAHAGPPDNARFGEAAAAALGWLALHIGPQCLGSPARACMVEDGRAPLGVSALTAIAMLEYERRTGDRRYAALAGRLLAFLRHMQQPSGEFHHLGDPASGQIVPGPPRMFASEQASLALVLGHRLRGDPADLAAAERALDYLTAGKYDYFLGRFYYGADHWTCIAADEAWPALRHRRYLDFCAGYARFMQRLQYAVSSDSARDFAGHYGFGRLMVPQAPATAGFSEALLSTLALARHHGADCRARSAPGCSIIDTAPLEGQTRLALAALTRDQLGADNSYLLRSPERAAGGFRRSLVEPEIRIDFVQHAASALVRGHALGIR